MHREIKISGVEQIQIKYCCELCRGGWRKSPPNMTQTWDPGTPVWHSNQLSYLGHPFSQDSD
jgi:hypothetical protein